MHTILSPYRDLTRPVLQYLDEIDADSPDDVITVIIPEFVTQWKTQWLHNQSAFALKGGCCTDRTPSSRRFQSSSVPSTTSSWPSRRK